MSTVLDPEVPALSVCDLGLVREVIDHGAELEVVLTPTYSGCPATEVIEQSVREAIDREGLGPVRISLRRAPAWTTDWITDEGKRKLNDYGIAPPGPVSPDAGIPIRFYAPQRSAACRLPAMRQPPYRTSFRLRLDGLQVDVPLPQLSRAVRAFQADLSRRP